MSENNAKRVVVLVDMDCFYCQVEVQHNQSLVGKPVAVVQYNSWKGGGIIAVNYEARAKGVNRHMRGDDAVQKCPDLNLVRVKELHGKADLSRYRTASQKVFDVLSKFSPCVQRASIDEAYIDLTSVVNKYVSSNQNLITEADLPNTFVEGYSDHNSKEDRNESIKSWLYDVYNNELQDECLLRLTIGAMMVETLRKSIYDETGFRCSAGIANNKILAKLACGLHKPNQQTLLPPSSVPQLFETIAIKKVRNLGGKLGNKVKEEFNCEFMSDLAAIPLNDLKKKFDDKTSNFLFQIAKGIDNELVESRLIPKSIGSCKSFPLGLKVKEEVHHWLNTLINDVVEKLEADYEANKRKATSITVSVRYSNKQLNLPTSHCGEVTTYDHNKLLDIAYSLLCTMTENQKSLNWKNPISFLGLAVGKFVKYKARSSIGNYFNKEIEKVEKDVTQSSSSENKKSFLKNSDSTEENHKDTGPCNEQQRNLKNNEPISNQTKPLVNNLNFKRNEASSSHVKDIKTMFAEMKNSKSSSTVTVQNLDVTNEKQHITKQNKFNMSSFFSKKLEIVSPSKNLVDNEPIVSTTSCTSKKLDVSSSKNIQNNKVEKINQAPVSFFCKKLEMSPSKIIKHSDEEKINQTPVSFFCKKLEMSPSKIIKHSDEEKINQTPVSFISEKQEVSPSKVIQNNKVEKNNETAASFFSKKLEIVSPSKVNTSSNSVSIVETLDNQTDEIPTELLCERCEKMIDINQYDEHIDLHVAMELSKSLNETNIVQPGNSEMFSKSKSLKNKNESGQKRKYKSKTKATNAKKPCKSISSYFEPLLNS